MKGDHGTQEEGNQEARGSQQEDRPIPQAMTPGKAFGVLLVLAACVLASGCAALPDLSNRVACEVGGGGVYVVSQWGPVGVTGRVHADDAKVIREACRLPRAGP